MSKNLKHAVDDQPNATRRAQLDLDEKWQPVLRQILTDAQRAPDTPLRFGIDSDEIVDAALKSFFIGEATEKAECSHDWEVVRSVFEALLMRALLDEPDCQVGPWHPLMDVQSHASHNAGNGDSRRNGVRDNKKTQHPLAAWLERFYARMREVHPSAIEIVRLRMEDYTSREVAQRLGIGLRLVQRITEDMRSAMGSPEVHP